jgi:hypothetical protein
MTRAAQLKAGDIIEFSKAQAVVTNIEVLYRLTYEANGHPHIVTASADKQFELAAQQGLV